MFEDAIEREVKRDLAPLKQFFATYRKRVSELEAENAKLREALRGIVEHKMLGIDPGTPSWREKIEAARAALSQED